MQLIAKVFLFILIIWSSSFSQTLNDSLIVHYTFNGNPSDLSINKLDGTEWNTQLTKDRFNNDSSAYYFNGENSFIDMGNSELLKPTFPISISVWIKKLDDNQGWIFGNNLNPENYMGVFIGFGDNNILSLHFGNGLQVGSLDARRSAYAENPIKLDNWYHIVGIIESPERMRLFLNGDSINTTISGTAEELVYNDSIAVLGKYHNWINQNARFFHGLIDDFRFYNRVLKDNEIMALFNEGIMENPIITSIQDVPNDQGGMVEVEFIKSFYDTDYLVLEKPNSPEIYTVEYKNEEKWTAIGSTVAYGKLLYNILVPTTIDSTLKSNGETLFRVIGGMEEGMFASNELIGYSVDNINPSTPNGVNINIIDNNIELTWNEVYDSDFNYYNIYRNTENSFNEDTKSIYQTTEQKYLDTQIDSGITYYYCIKSIDYSDNQSDFSEIVSTVLTSVIDDDLKSPNVYNLCQNYPNPFNPSTKIRYSISKSGNVKIKLYDVLGSEIRRLIDEYKEIGTYEIDFNAEELSNGIYFYSINSGDFTATKKMILVK